MSNEITKTSKFLSLLLRHKPETIGLELDDQGWANIEELMALGAKHDRPMNLLLIQEVVATNDKNRFSISEDGRFIRANQGHSISVDLALESVRPPEFLFHGTATRFIDSIFEQGLIKRNRQHACNHQNTASLLMAQKLRKQLSLYLGSTRHVKKEKNLIQYSFFLPSRKSSLYLTRKL